VNQGFLVYRFNWTSFLKNPTNPPRSRRFEQEIENIQQVVSVARTDSRVDPARIVLAGKSMGSVLSFSLMQKESIARGLVIITPLCNNVESEEPKIERSYPDLIKVAFPILFLLGDKDPNCDLATLGKTVRGAGGNVLVGLVEGNHYLTYGTKVIDAVPDNKDQTNLDVAAKLAVQWSKNVVAEPKAP
jgi:surfactin synthase thioesterase subunit